MDDDIVLTSPVIFARALILSYFRAATFSGNEVLAPNIPKKETKIISAPRIKISVNDRILLPNRETNKAINRLNSALTQFSNRIFPSSLPSLPFF